MTYHIWLLNAAESLLSPSWIRHSFEKLLDAPVIWETRTVGQTTTSNLMPDEEYFVPIAIKCLGNLWDHPSRIAPEGKPILAQMKKLYFDQWKIPSWENFWDQSSGFRNMQTPPGVGYYELIQSHHKEGDKHILIGYSQGGVVARFLACVDEYLFKNHMIDCVITIASPLRGSPLADPSHREEVTDAMVKILLALFSFYESYGQTSGYVRVMKQIKRKIQFEDLYHLLSAWIEDSRSLASLSSYYPTIGNYLATFQKWLSGLRGIKESAFWELAPRRMMNLFSVLGLIQRPIQAKTATILTCNHHVEEIARDYLALSQGPWIRWFWNIGKEWFLSRKIGGQSLRTNLLTIQNLYDTEIMGLDPSQDHDFMVPSSRQYLEDHPPLGLFLAKKANHLSGKDPFSPGGKEIVFSLLRALKRYTTWQP
ncbi:MAG: GPI inositol-deacylase [Brevinematales bacterium]|nr:GPI inositol-deacylase [Brevinematales bacterium]